MRPDRLKFLLLQIRNPDDPMRGHEVACFSRALCLAPGQLEVWDLLGGVPDPAHLARVDAVLVGGSGHYSATGSEPWLLRALDLFRSLYEQSRPMFASCWGFQGLARALGGTVVRDPDRAEVGTHWVRLTDDGLRDPVFGILGSRFPAQMGHEDSVIELPPGAVRLASTDRVENQAYRIAGRPIWCTQFHPELRGSDLYARICVYPEYLERITGLPLERFCELVRESPETDALLPKFVETVFAE